MDRRIPRTRILSIFIALTAALASGCASHSPGTSFLNSASSMEPDGNKTNVQNDLRGPSGIIEEAAANRENIADDSFPFSDENGGYDTTDLWARIRAGYGLPPLDSKRIARHEKWFSGNPKYMQRMMERARLYLYYIVEEVEKRGMPLEIALLPAIESAYKPHAYSRARAMGLWQFIPSTGRLYGLKANWWYEGRRDVLASTNAALDYLEKLYKDFDGNWHLALAAYNAGEGRVKRAIRYNRRRGRSTKYQHLRLKRETLNYVPKLIAMANIIADPAKYGLKLAGVPNEPYFAKVDVGSQIDLDVVARLTDVPVGDLYDINPGFKRWASDPNGPHHLLVPAEKKEVLLEGLSNLPKHERIQWKRHYIRRGDTLSGIARRYGVSIRVIKAANNLRGNFLRAGKNLMIPISSRKLSTRHANITRPLRRVRTAAASSSGRVRIVHRVRKGETLYSIARKYRVYINQITRWNVINKRDFLQLGQRLKIWVRPSRVPSASLASHPTAG